MSSAHDFSELARSASEASKIKLVDVDLARFQHPPENTCYPLEYAFYLLGNVRDKLVVDLGCGSGEEVVPLRQRGARVVGIDISPEMIAIARERLRKYSIDAELRVGSAYETGMPDDSADVVFCMSILHHLDLARAKKEICRILKPGGLWILKEPVRYSWTLKHLRRFFPAHEDVSEFEYPLDRDQVKMLSEGFRILSSRSFRTPLVPLVERTRAPRWMKRAWIRVDAWTLRRVPGLDHLATVRVVGMRADRLSH